jgi:glutaredoxin-related protein
MIRLYGKASCGKCISAEDKLHRLNVNYEKVDLENPPSNWRETLLAEARAWYDEHIHDNPEIALPTIEIDGTLYSYPAAMAKLKQS